MERITVTLARAIIDELASDPEALDRLRVLLAPEPLVPADDDWMDSKRAARYAGCSYDTLKKAMARRELQFSQNRPGGKAYFRRADLDAWRRR